MKQFFEGIRKKGQGNKFVKEDIIHVITSHNVEQEVQKLVRSDVVIPNKLDNDKTCQGLRHWRLLSNLKNNFSKPVRNDMGVILRAIARRIYVRLNVDSSLFTLALNGYDYVLHPLLAWLRMTK